MTAAAALAGTAGMPAGDGDVAAELAAALARLDDIARYCHTAQAKAPGSAMCGPHAKALRESLSAVFAMTGRPLRETDPLEMLWAHGWGHAGTRACNGLLRAGKRTVADVAALTGLDVAGLRNLGTGSVSEVRRVLRLAGFDLAAGGDTP